MNVWGHIAVGSLLNGARSEWSYVRLGSLVFGALLPDIIDKSLKFAGVFPWGRTIGHSAFVWAAFHLLVAYAIFETSRRPPATPPRALGSLSLISIGWFSHFLADLADDLVQGATCTGQALSAWMGWPLTNPDMYPIFIGPKGPECFTGFEMAVVLIALLAASLSENTKLSKRRFRA